MQCKLIIQKKLVKVLNYVIKIFVYTSILLKDNFKLSSKHNNIKYILVLH